MTEEPKTQSTSLFTNLRHHITEVRDIVILIAGILLAAFQAFATQNWSTIIAYSLAGLIVLVTLLLIFLRRRTKRKISITPPKGAPFRGLLFFEEDDSDQFYGREIELGALYQMASHSDFRFGVLTGESGCGKTSLVKAGLIPRLRENNYLPIYVRLYRHPEEMIKEAVRVTSKFAQELEEEELKVYLRQVANRTGKTLVLVCDQFEEFFIHFRSKRLRGPFIDLVEACYHETSLPVKFLFVLREDYLSRISEFDNRIPEPLAFNKRYHLRNFTKDQALEIIERSVRAADVPFETGLSAQIANDLATFDVVLPTELQIVCQRMQTERIFTVKQYQESGSKESIVYGYLEDIVKGSGEEELAKLVLRCLISDENTKLALPFADICERTQKSKARVRSVLNLFVKARLLRELQDEEPWRYELTHEYLIDKINAITGKVMDATKRANFMFKQWLIKFSIESNTRIPLREWWFIKRHSDLTRGSSENELLTKSLHWGIIKTAVVILLTTSATVALVFMATPTYSPQIHSLSPTSGLPGTIVTVAGSNFDAGFGRAVQVMFGNAPADIIEVSPSRIITRVPKTAQNDKIRVSVAGLVGKRTTSSQHIFVVNVGHPIKNAPKTAVRVGSRPKDIAFSPDGRWAYVVNTGSNDVSVIDFWSDQEVDVDQKPENGLTRIPVGDSPAAIAVTQDGARAYVANRGSDDVSVLDLLTRKEIKRIRLGEGPLRTYTTLDGVKLTRPLDRRPIDVAISPNSDAVYIGNETSGDVSVISPDTDNVKNIVLVEPSNRATVKGGKEPTSMAISPDGKKAYVTMMNAAAIKVIDLGRGVVVNTIDLHDDTPRSIVLSPHGEQAYVATGWVNNGSLVVINTVSDKIQSRIFLNAHIPAKDVAVSQDGSRIFVSIGDTIRMIDASSKQVVGDISVGVPTGKLAVHPRKTRPRLYAIAKGHIKLVDTHNRRILPISLYLGKSPEGIAVSPDGQRGYVTDKEENAVYIIDLLSNRKVSKIEIGIAPKFITVTPDGKKAYVTNVGEDSVSVVDLNPGHEAEIDVDGDDSNGITRIHIGEPPRHLAITPDGKSIYVLGERDVRVIDVAGNTMVGAPIILPDTPGRIAIAPDGRYGYVTRQDEVSVIDLKHGKVVDQLNVCKDPIWITTNPTGTSLYVDCNEGLVEVDLATKKVVGKIGGWGLRWIALAMSPDGKRVYWSNMKMDRLPINAAIRVIDTVDNTEIDTDNDARNGITSIIVGPNNTISSMTFGPEGSRSYVVSRRGLMIIE